jgi:predicted adenylyl cyclase CyaB
LSSLEEENEMENNIEVEIRSFIPKEKYEELLEFFKKNAKLLKEDFQETHYFDSDVDLRIQKNNFFSKIWMKSGKIHEEFREETEVRMPKEDFEKLGIIFSSIGLDVEIKWLRNRKEFDWEGTIVCLDFTKGYGYLIELEKMSSEENKQEALFELEKKFSRLGISPTSKKEFDEKYDYYKKNWRNLINE